MTKSKKVLVRLAGRLAVAFTLALALSAPVVVLADAHAPTNGGNGAGHSGQCTGNPDSRPPGLDCAH